MNQSGLRRITGMLLLSTLFVSGCSQNSPAPAPSPDTQQSSDKATEKPTESSSTEASKEQANYEQLPLIDWDKATDLTKEQLEAASTHYYLYGDDGNEYDFNLLGEVINAKSVSVFPIKDVLTTEVRFYRAQYSTYEYTEITDESDEAYDSYTLNGPYSRLYDANGKLIKDWTKTRYSDCIGDWVLEKGYSNADENSEDRDGRLFNPYTSEIIDRVDGLTRLGDQYVYAYRLGNYLYSVLDRNGNILSEGKVGDKGITASTFSYVVGEYVALASSKSDYFDFNETYDLAFINPDGSVAGTFSDAPDPYFEDETTDLTYYTINGRCYDIKNANGGEIQPVTTDGYAVGYYSSEIIVYFTQSDGDEPYCCLYDTASNKKLAGPYRSIQVPDNRYAENTSSRNEYVYGISDSGIDVIDTNGKVINSLMQEAINDIYIYDSYIYCSYNDYIDTLFTDLTLHKMDLGKYTSIRPLYADKANDAEATEYLVGSYYLDKDSGRERYDILTSDFKPISTVLSRVGNLKKDRIPIIKGQSLGIIDLKGNWVLKYNKADFINAD